MVSVIECNRAETQHIAQIWMSFEDRRERPWTLSRPAIDWGKRSGVSGIEVGLILEVEGGEPWVAWLAAAGVTKSRNDDLNCKIQAYAAYKLLHRVRWGALVDQLNPNVRKHFRRDGTLSKGTGKQVLAVLRELAADTVAAIARIEVAHDSFTIETAAHERKAFERDAAITALRMAGFDPDLYTERVTGSPADAAVPWALPGAKVIEDQQLGTDLAAFRDWFPVGSAVGSSVFVDPLSGQKLHVYNANRSSAEKSTGADLIYYHEDRQCFVLVQYKKLTAGKGDDKWRYYPKGDKKNLSKERERLLAIDQACAGAARPTDDYRLSGQATWFKFCQDRSLLPAGSSLVPGMYLPRPYLEELLASGKALGSGGGTVISYRTVQRYLDNTVFTGLVAGGWIGTADAGTDLVRKQIEISLGCDRDVLFAHGSGQPKSRAQQVTDQRGRSRRRRGTTST
jgi:hypothetical protein